MRSRFARLLSPNLLPAQLAEARFARLFTARLVSQFGSVMSPIAMAFGVLELTGSAQVTSIVVAAQIVAQVLVLLFGGALADRGHRQRILVVADCTAAASQANNVMCKPEMLMRCATPVARNMSQSARSGGGH